MKDIKSKKQDTAFGSIEDTFKACEDNNVVLYLNNLELYSIEPIRVNKRKKLSYE